MAPAQIQDGMAGRLRCTLRDGVVPENQDGEVARFECVPREEVLARLQRGLFTDEAALVLVQALGLSR